jgi:hypothetical protein
VEILIWDTSTKRSSNLTSFEHKISKNGDGVYSWGNFLYVEVVNELEVIDIIWNLRDRRCNDVTDLALGIEQQKKGAVL